MHANYSVLKCLKERYIVHTNCYGLQCLGTHVRMTVSTRHFSISQKRTTVILRYCLAFW